MKHTKKQRIIKLCEKNNLIFETENYEQGHKYNIWFNSKTGSKEILCKNLNECLDAITELLTIKN